MFCIKDKIYVTHDSGQYGLKYRTVNLLPQYHGLHSHPVTLVSPINHDRAGVCYSAISLDNLVEVEFQGDMTLFHDWLMTEEKLCIICSVEDYITLFATYLVELQSIYDLTESQLNLIEETQQLKMFKETNQYIEDFSTLSANRRQSLTTLGRFTSHLVANPARLPVELAYAFYKWGIFTANDINTKLETLKVGFLNRAFEIYFWEVRQLISVANFNVVERFLNDLIPDPLEHITIGTTQELINTVRSDYLLNQICFGEYNAELEGQTIHTEAHAVNTTVDLEDEVTRTEALRLIDIMIEEKFNIYNTGLHLMSTINPALPATWQELYFYTNLKDELVDLWVNFYESDFNNLITHFEHFKFNMICHGYIEKRTDRINTPLLMRL